MFIANTVVVGHLFAFSQTFKFIESNASLFCSRSGSTQFPIVKSTRYSLRGRGGRRCQNSAAPAQVNLPVPSPLPYGFFPCPS